MKSKRLAMCVMIAVWFIAGLMVDGYPTNRAAAQSRAEPIEIQWERIGVMPFFKGRRSADTGESLACPICELSFKSENIKDGAERVITTSLFLGIVTSIFFKLCSLAPLTTISFNDMRDRYPLFVTH